MIHAEYSVTKFDNEIIELFQNEKLFPKHRVLLGTIKYELQNRRMLTISQNTTLEMFPTEEEYELYEQLRSLIKNRNSEAVVFNKKYRNSHKAAKNLSMNFDLILKQFGEDLRIYSGTYSESQYDK